MKRLITVAALLAAATCAQATQKKSDGTATAPATAPTPASASSVPKDAVKNADGTWSYTDKQGRKWVYVNTPFGIMKNEITDADSRRAAALAPGTKVIDKGDTVRFEQPGPFGPIAWEKKKSDLTDQERQTVEAQTQTAKPEAK
jgi:hypothetical protein